MDAELDTCHMLARIIGDRCAIVTCGTVTCTILATEIEPWMTVHYVTI